MAIPAANIDTPLIPPNARMPFVDKQGNLPVPSLQFLQQLYVALNGGLFVIPCNVSYAANVYSLTPVTVSPQLPAAYCTWQGFGFTVPATGDSNSKIEVMSAAGSSLGQYKIYDATGSVLTPTIHYVYIAYFVDSLNSGNGGFTLK